MKKVYENENAGQTNALDIDEKKRLGAALKEFREGRNLNQEQMASIISCTGQYVSDVERGKYCLSLKKYLTLCDHFSVSIDELLYGRHENYSKFDVRNRIIRQLDTMNIDQIELLEDQIKLMKRMFDT